MREYRYRVLYFDDGEIGRIDIDAPVPIRTKADADDAELGVKALLIKNGCTTDVEVLGWSTYAGPEPHHTL